MEDQQVVLDGGGMDASAVTQEEAVAYGDERFAVRFEKAANHYGLEIGPAKFRGNGRITIQGSVISFDGRSCRLGWLCKEKHFDVPDSDAFNVQRSDKAIILQLRNSAGTFFSIRITASSTLAAARLASRLPAHQTPEFAVASAERSEFHERLDALSPKAIAVPVLVGINIVVFIAMCVSGVGIFTVDGNAVLSWGSNYGPLTAGGQWWRLLSNMFVHFGVIHVSLNMWALYASGRTVERLFGTGRFIVLYLFAGIAASMVSLLWNQTVNSAGASGAIFGVFGGMLAFVMNKRNEVPQSVMIEHRNSTLGFAAYSLFYGVAHTGVDNAAHIGGLVSGLAMGFVLARPLTSEARRAPRPASFWLSVSLGAAALFALSWPMTHPNAQTARTRQFAVLLGHLSEDENVAVGATNALQQRTTSQKLSNQEVARELSSAVSPKWDALYSEVAAVQLQPGDADFELHNLLLQYFDARRQQFALLARSLPNNDMAILEQSNAQRASADKALSELKAERSKKP
ncbi:rhomboid family intramembrane serine protease [Pinirhizobacter soli]|uniref:rhomboid family intramembrane serine protease n=1 Tax=Pinirhizobacter soli TaxID=2786953 RepID=UPI00202A41FE|nr:rhomboid family intramembrane serine protease [Pinirhizobacter soli]